MWNYIHYIYMWNIHVWEMYGLLTSDRSKCVDIACIFQSMKRDSCNI